jgi:hypothetical protein
MQKIFIVILHRKKLGGSNFYYDSLKTKQPCYCLEYIYNFSKVLSDTNTSNYNMIMHTGKGTNPEWNENFVFTVSDQTADLLIKLMDSDTGTADDFVGEAT